MASQILGIFIIVAAVALYFFIRRDQVQPIAASKTIRFALGALVIAFVLVVDDLYTCINASCESEFINALALKHVSILVVAAYAHIGFALLELLLYAVSSDRSRENSDKKESDKVTD